MGKRLFVGNLPYNATAEDLRSFFGEIGEITDVHIVMDRETGRPRGFAFVSYAKDEDAAKAAETMNGKAFGGRPLVVNEARERGAAEPGGGPPRRSSGPPSGNRPPRPEGGSFRPGGGPRPGGPGGFRAGGGGGGFRPGGGRPFVPEPDELPPTEERRRQSPAKKKFDVDRERAPKTRPREEEEAKGGGNWRQWIESEDDEK